jgi:TonB-linked SusC/RagA family outer membrane protein
MRTVPFFVAGLLIVLLGVPEGRLSSQTTGTIRGTVTGTGVQPVAGAQVGIVGTRGAGAVTNAAGVFVINGARAGDDSLRVQMIGYGPLAKSVTVSAGQTATVNFELVEVALNLSQVVITGTAGEQTRISQPATVGVLNAENMMQTAPKGDMSGILQSQLPGVVDTQGSGSTGAAPRIRIRGPSSISLSDDPLVFVDGVRIDSRTVNSSSANGGGSSTSAGGQGTSFLNDLNPEDIQSVEVVKGPAAATLYGADASGGVINIITKKGQAGGFQQTLLAEYDAIDVHWTPMTNWGLCTQALITAGATPICVGKTAGTMVSDNPLIRDKVFREGAMRLFNWNGSGGTAGFRYFVSVADNEEDGVYPSSNLERTTFHVNTTSTSRPDLTLNVGFQLLENQNRQPDDDHSLYGFGANTGIGSPLTLGLPQNGWLSAGRFEPQIAAIKNTVNSTRVIPTTTLTYQPAAWISQRLTVGADFNGDARTKMVPLNNAGWYQAVDNPGFVKETRENYRVVTADYLGTITHSFGSAQHWEAQLAYGAQLVWTTTDLVFANGTGLATNAARVVSAASSTVGGQTFSDVRGLGYLGQLQVSYMNRLYLQAGLRIDQNSSFGTQVPSMVLPKAGASWVITEEPFMKGRFPWLSQLRVRAAVGVTGRAPLAGSSLQTYAASASGQTGANTPGLTLANPGNPFLAPERGGEVEGGIDASFLQNRLGIELTYFRKVTNNLILQRQLPSSDGFTANPFVNIGSVENDGLEASISAQLIQERSTAWDMRLTFSTLHNELTSLGNVPAFGVNTRFNVGYPLGFDATRTVTAVSVANGNATVSDTNNYVGTQFPKFEGNIISTWTFGRVQIAATLDWKTGFVTNNATNEYRTQQVVRTPVAVNNALLSP